MITIDKMTDKMVIAQLLEGVTEHKWMRSMYQALLQNQLASNKLEKLTRAERTLLLKVAKLTLDKLQPLQHVVQLDYMTAPVGVTRTLTCQEVLKEENTDPKLTHLCLEVLTRTVEAGTTRTGVGVLRTENYEDGYVSALSSELADNIIETVVGQLHAMSKTHETIVAENTVRTDDESPAFVGDYLSKLLIRLNQASNKIARRTRRGCGNFIITTPMGVAILQSINPKLGFEFRPALESETSPSTFMYIGDLVHTNTDRSVWKVMSWLPMNAAIRNEPGEMYIVGYKNRSIQNDDSKPVIADTGYTFCPYVLALPITWKDSETDQEYFNLCHRSGYVLNNNVATEHSHSENTAYDYYQLVTANIAAEFSTDTKRDTK